MIYEKILEELELTKIKLQELRKELEDGEKNNILTCDRYLIELKMYGYIGRQEAYEIALHLLELEANEDKDI